MKYSRTILDPCLRLLSWNLMNLSVATQTWLILENISLRSSHEFLWKIIVWEIESETKLMNQKCFNWLYLSHVSQWRSSNFRICMNPSMIGWLFCGPSALCMELLQATYLLTFNFCVIVTEFGPTFRWT